MRARVAVTIPTEATPDQLLAVASLVSTIGAGRWEDLARSFTRMEQTGAVISRPMSALLEGLGHQLRQAARERAALVAADDLGGP
jgi:hypothetical protein